MQCLRQDKKAKDRRERQFAPKDKAARRARLKNVSLRIKKEID
jgi:hypothetical protein